MSEEFRLRESDDYKVYFINHKNTKIGGSVEVDPDGFASIYINSRRSAAQQQETLRHELRHLQNGDLDNDDPIEVVEARATAREIIPERPEPPAADPAPQAAQPQKKPDARSGLPLSEGIRQDAAEAFGFPANDPQWPEIIWALLVTGASLPKDDPRAWTSYYYSGARVRKGRVYPSSKQISHIYALKRRRVLQYK